MAGGGDTEDTRWDEAVKYRFAYGPVHFGAMYKFADGPGGCYSPLGTWTRRHLHAGSGRTTPPMDSISAELPAGSPPTSSSSMSTRRSACVNPLLGPTSLRTPYQSTHRQHQHQHHQRRQSDRDDQHRVWHRHRQHRGHGRGQICRGSGQDLGGYEYIRSEQPVGSARHRRLRPGRLSPERRRRRQSGLPEDRAGHVDGREIRARQQDRHHGVLSITSGRTTSACRRPARAAGFRSSCAGALNEVSLYADHHFTKRVDAYAGIAYSDVNGGLAIAIPHGPGVPYNYDNNVAPTLGTRFTF